jgi:hypothetical protein
VEEIIFKKPIFNGKKEAWNLEFRNVALLVQYNVLLAAPRVNFTAYNLRSKRFVKLSICWNKQMIHIRNILVFHLDKTSIIIIGSTALGGPWASN